MLRIPDRASPTTERIPKNDPDPVRDQGEQRGGERAPDRDHRDPDAVEDDVHALDQVLEALVAEADLDLPVAHLLERVVHLVRKLVEHRGHVAQLVPGAPRDPLWREALDHELARVRLRDVEDVEVRVELHADRPERGDRAVEEDETRRQLQVHPVDERERLPDELDRVDLREARAVVAVVDVAQLGDELLLEILGVAHAERRESLRQGFDPLADGVDEETGEAGHVLVGQLPDHAEVDEADLLRRLEHHDVRGVRVGMEEAVAEDHVHPRLGDQVREPLPLLDGIRVRVEIPELNALEQLEREDPRARVAPEDPGHAHVRVPGEVTVELLGVSRLHPVVELLADGAGEFVDERDGVDELERLHAVANETRRLIHELEVGFDLARRIRPLHLDGDAASVRERRPVHLADRRGGDRLLLEVEEELLDGELELLLDHALDRRYRRPG